MSIIKDSLIRSRNQENIFKDKSGFPSRDAKRDMESKSKTKSIKGVSDIKDSRFNFSRGRVN